MQSRIPSRQGSRRPVERMHRKKTRGHSIPTMHRVSNERAHLWYPPSYVPVMHTEIVKYFINIKTVTRK